MPKIAMLKQFLSQASARVLRSSVLGPLAWMTVILITAILLSVFFKTPFFITTILVIFICLIILLFIASYIYFMIKDPDFLRSETYSIQKLAIERGIVGDNLLGIIERDNLEKTEVAVNVEKQE